MALHIALMTVGIIAMAGLGSEITYLFAKHRQMQVVADAAALSAAAASLYSTSASAPSIEARAIAAQLGFVHGANGVDVAMNNPPTSGAHAANTRAYEVVVNQTQTLGLVGVLRSTLFPVRTRAVATLNQNSSAPICVLALDTSASEAIYIQNNGALTSNRCGLASNSSSSRGIYLKNNAYVNGPVSTVGGWKLENNAHFYGSPLTQNASPIDDPYANVTLPSVPACTGQTSSGGNNGTYNLTPGHFCNGWDFKNNVTINLSPGIYYIDSKLILQNNAWLNGTGGVTIVINGNYEIDIKNNAYLNITAPTTGANAGVAIMGLRDGTSTAVQTFENNVVMNIDGAVYFPNQIIEFENNGTTGASGCTQVIGRIVRLSNNVLLDSACENSGVKQIFVQQGFLVE